MAASCNWFLSLVIMELVTDSPLSMRETQRHLKYIRFYRIFPCVIGCGLGKHFSPEMILSFASFFAISTISDDLDKSIFWGFKHPNCFWMTISHLTIQSVNLWLIRLERFQKSSNIWETLSIKLSCTKVTFLLVTDLIRTIVLLNAKVWCSDFSSPNNLCCIYLTIIPNCEVLADDVFWDLVITNFDWLDDMADLELFLCLCFNCN